MGYCALRLDNIHIIFNKFQKEMKAVLHLPLCALIYRNYNKYFIIRILATKHAHILFVKLK